MRRLPLFLLLAPLCAVGQKIENVKAEVQGATIVLTYDLSQGQAGDSYTVSIFPSTSNFKVAMKRVSGDVGKGVKEGKGKRIVWDAKVELVTYKGEISFEVQAEVVAPLSFTQTKASAKRGTNEVIAWRGGDRNQDVKIELLKGGAVTDVLATVNNDGSYTWNVPSKQKPGSDYQLRLSNGKETVMKSVAIKHKIPTLLKVVPLVAIAAVAATMGGGGGGGDNGGNPPAEKLASPPDMGLN